MPGRRGGGSSRGGPPPQSREVVISKAMSFVLRHGAEAEGLKLDMNGYANVAELLSWKRLRSLKVTFPELREIVDQNAKKRFTLIPLTSIAGPTSSTPVSSEDPAQYLIRAAQGHSLTIASENLLTPITADDADCPERVVHGTNTSAWNLILKSGGLKKMGRQHIHFATGIPEPPARRSTSQTPESDPKTPPAEPGESIPKVNSTEVAQRVISGMRRTATVMVWVDVKRSMREGGLKWWKSDNGVVLTEGDEKGRLGLEWVVRVEDRETGEVIWEPGEDGKGGGAL